MAFKNGIILIKSDTSINHECSIISLELLTQHATQMSHTAPRKVMHYIFGRDYIKTGSLGECEVPRNSILSLKVMINFINGYLPCLKYCRYSPLFLSWLKNQYGMDGRTDGKTNNPWYRFFEVMAISLDKMYILWCYSSTASMSKLWTLYAINFKPLLQQVIMQHYHVHLAICVTHPWLSATSSCCGCQELFSLYTDKCQSLKTWALSGLWKHHRSWDQQSWSGPVPSWVHSSLHKPGHLSTGSPAITLQKWSYLEIPNSKI